MELSFKTRKSILPNSNTSLARVLLMHFLEHNSGVTLKLFFYKVVAFKLIIINILFARKFPA